MPTIAIDYTPAFEQGGGIGRYVRELVAALAEKPPAAQYRLFVAGTTSPPQTALPTNWATWRTTRINQVWLARIWHKARLPVPVEAFVGNVDLFHATDFVLPPTRPATKTLLTVHDLSFIRAPHTATPALRRYLGEVVPRSVQRADHILADSAATKRDLIDLYGTPSDKITVLLSGVHWKFQPVEAPDDLAAVREKYQLGERPYVFAIGTVQPRKNYGRLAQAVAHLRDKGHDINLVIAGGRGWLEDQLYREIDPIRDHVIFTGFADDTDIPALYSGAMCTAFVSLYEGFGLPVLESMACGTPVVASNISSIPEVAGEAAPLVAPEDVLEIAGAIERILEDQTYRQRLIDKGFEQAAKFTWAKAADQLQSVYQTLLAS